MGAFLMIVAAFLAIIALFIFADFGECPKGQEMGVVGWSFTQKGAVPAYGCVDKERE